MVSKNERMLLENRVNTLIDVTDKTECNCIDLYIEIAIFATYIKIILSGAHTSILFLVLF